MSAKLLTITCDAFKNNISSGLSRLQGRQEFVDLTLAADGHLVKVHKNVIALASPYLKEMIQSLSSENPVIFLFNVSHKDLTFLLEYIYQGEVIVPKKCLESFLQVAKSLHIIGINQSITPKKQNTGKNNIQPQVQTNINKTQAPANILIQQQTEIINEKPEESLCIIEPQAPISTFQPNVNNITQAPENILQLEVETSVMQTPSTHTFQQLETNIDNLQASASIVEPRVETSLDRPAVQPNERPTNFAASITINNDRNFEVQQFAENLPLFTVAQENIGDQLTDYSTTVPENMPDIENMPFIVSNNMDVDMGLNNDQETNLNVTSEEPLLNIHLDQESKDALTKISQFSITERGAAQIILNRFIYCTHHSSRRGRRHRWRCLDYRKLKCPAYVDSLDNHVIRRYGIHQHQFHDEKIYEKRKNGKVFISVEQAKASRELGIPVSTADDIEDVENEIDPCIITTNYND